MYPSQSTPASTACKMAGFTLIELMVTLAITAIIVTQAVPSFDTMIKNNRLVSQTNSLVGDINLARSEAVKRGVRVILCRSADPTLANPTCGGTANTWTSGWLVFASGDGNNTYQVGVDTLIRVGKPRANSLQIKTNNTSNHNLEYNSDGTTNEAGGTAAFAICDDRDGDGTYDTAFGRQIQVNPVGHVKLIQAPIPNCDAPNVV